MPRKFVTRLRAIRQLQKKHQNEQQAQMLRSNQTDSVQRAHQVFNSTAIDELVDELS